GIRDRNVTGVQTCALPILSKINSTSAIFSGFRLLVPEKMTSFIRSPRKVLADCSPITQRIASIIFDLPLPFGPTIAVTPWLNSNVVFSGNDLNPFNIIFFNCTKYFSFTQRIFYFFNSAYFYFNQSYSFFAAGCSVLCFDLSPPVLII